MLHVQIKAFPIHQQLRILQDGTSTTENTTGWHLNLLQRHNRYAIIVVIPFNRSNG